MVSASDGINGRIRIICFTPLIIFFIISQNRYKIQPPRCIFTATGCILGYKNKKAPIFRSRLLCFSPLFIKRWFRSCDLHTRSLTNRFVCNFLSSSAGFNLCSCFFPARPCLAAFSGLPLSRPVAASASLSDPRCFRALSTASVLGSDYSASVSSFPSLPDSASQWLPQCSALTFAPAVFPVLSCLVSRAFAPGSGTQLRRMFPFALP